MMASNARITPWKLLEHGPSDAGAKSNFSRDYESEGNVTALLSHADFQN